MSYDLEVVTGQRVELPPTRRSDIEVDGPFEVTDHDLSPLFWNTVQNARWLYQISVPEGAPEVARRAARRMAKSLAIEGEGAAADLVADRILTATRRPEFRSPPSEERISILELDWCFRVDRRTDHDTPTELRGLIRRWFPEATPRRAGVFEPLRRLEQDEAFDLAWRDAMDGSDVLSWGARLPSYGGGVGGGGEGRAFRVNLSFDGRAFTSGGPWLDSLLNLFHGGCETWTPVMAALSMNRWVIARGRSIWFDGRSETDVLSGYWTGLDLEGLWTVYLGAALTEMCATSGFEFGAEAVGGGSYRRFSEFPMDRSELRGLVPRVPPELKNASRGVFR